MGPGLQILPSSQGSQADPAEEKMVSWKDTTSNDLSPPACLPTKESKTTSNLVLLQDYLQLRTQIETPL